MFLSFTGMGRKVHVEILNNVFYLLQGWVGKSMLRF